MKIEIEKLTPEQASYKALEIAIQNQASIQVIQGLATQIYSVVNGISIEQAIAERDKLFDLEEAKIIDRFVKLKP